MSLHDYSQQPNIEPSEKALSPSYGSALLHWQAPEHEPLELGPRSRVIIVSLLIAIIGWALYTNSPLMAITFILIGVTGYLTLGHEPRTISFYATTKGLIAGSAFYEFETIESFHFYDEPPFDNLLSIKTNGKLLSHVHIPVANVSIAELYRILIQHIPEDKHDPSLVDTLEKLLHI